MQNTNGELKPGFYYHVYNRANGSEKMFKNHGNYTFFIEKYLEYIQPIANTFCYCLMPNHFHFLIQIKEEKEILQFMQGFNPGKDLLTQENLDREIQKTISNQFSKFFNSYAKAFNKQQNRRGSLFMKNFKRKPITDEKYLRKIVHYIHNNPVESGLCKNPEDWAPSSFKILTSDYKTFLKRKEVIDWFEEKENFIYIHCAPQELSGIN